MKHETFKKATEIQNEIFRNTAFLNSMRLDWNQGFGLPEVIRIGDNRNFVLQFPEPMTPIEQYKHNESQLLFNIQELTAQFAAL